MNARLFSVWALAMLAGLCGACSDPKTGPSLASNGSADGTAASADSGSGTGDLAGSSGNADADASTGPGYSPLDPAIKGNWMQQQIGNCINSEEWLVLAPPETLVRTIVDRNDCGAHGVSKVAGNMKILPGQLLELTWQDKIAYQQWKRTAAVLDSVNGISDPVGLDPNYKRGKRGMTVLAFVRPSGGAPFVRSDIQKRVTDKPKTVDVTKTTAVQIQITPTPDGAKPGDTCTMSATISAQYETTESTQVQTGSEKLEFPCHFSADKGTGWLRVTADGYDNGLGWDKMFDSKGFWKKYSKEIAQLLYDSFRPDLLQPAEQRGVLVSLSLFGWYYEFINEPPSSVK